MIAFLGPPHTNDAEAGTCSVRPSLDGSTSELATDRVGVYFHQSV